MDDHFQVLLVGLCCCAHTFSLFKCLYIYIYIFVCACDVLDPSMNCRGLESGGGGGVGLARGHSSICLVFAVGHRYSGPDWQSLPKPRWEDMPHWRAGFRED